MGKRNICHYCMQDVRTHDMVIFDQKIFHKKCLPKHKTMMSKPLWERYPVANPLGILNPGAKFHHDMSEEYFNASKATTDQDRKKDYWIRGDENRKNALSSRMMAITNPNRPPKKWWDKVAGKASLNYFHKSPKYLNKADKNRLGEIVGGIWKKFSPATKRMIMKKYEANPRTIDVTPTPEEYRKMLKAIMEASTVKADRIWAKKELDRVRGVKKWGKQNPDARWQNSMLNPKHKKKHTTHRKHQPKDYLFGVAVMAGLVAWLYNVNKSAGV